MATTIAERLLVNVEADSARLQAELGKAGQTVQRFSATAGQATTVAQGLGQRYSAAALQIASAAENMARAGKLGGEGLKQIIAQGSNMLFLFGPQGALVGALGITALAITEVFRKARDEAARTALETQQAIDALQNQGDGPALVNRLQVLEQGTPAKNFRDGIRGLREELADYEAALQTIEAKARTTAGAFQSIFGGGAQGTPLSKIRRQLEEDRDKVRAQLDALVREFQATEKAIYGAAPRPRPTTQPIRVTAAAPGQAAPTADAMRDVTQAFDDLFQKALAGDVTLADFDRRLRELGDTFADKLKTPTLEQVKAFSVLAFQAEEVRDVLQGITTQRIADEFEAMRAALTPTVVDDYAVRLKRLRAELQTKGFTGPMIDEILALETALADAAIGLETLETEIGTIVRQAISGFDAQVQLAGLLQQAEAQLQALEARGAGVATDPQAQIEINALRARIKLLQDEITRLSSGGGGAGVSDEALQQRAITKAQQLGRSLEDIGRLTLAAADAFGVLSDEAQQALTATVDVAAGIARLVASGGQDGGAQLAAGVVSLISAVAGRNPAAEQRAREHQENLAELRRITKNTGDLLGISTSGRDIASIRGAVGELLASTGSAGGFRRFGDGPLRNINEAAFLEFRTGLGFKEIEALAKSLGITLNGTKQSYLDFMAALRQVDLEATTRGFAGQLRRLEIEARLDPTAFDGLEGLIKRLRVLAGPDGAPAIAKALEGLDLRTSAGRAAAIERLTTTVRNLATLDVGDLGGLSLDEFIEEILAAIERLREAEPAARSATDRFSAAIDAWNVAVERGTLSAAERLEKIKEFARVSFSGLGDEALAGLDFSSFDAFVESAKRVVDAFAADGELTDAERAQIAVIEALTEAWKAATPAGETFVDALRVLEDRLAIFGASALERLQALGTGLADRFPSLGSLFEGLDLANDPTALNTLRERARSLFAQLAEDGVTEQEQAVIDALKKILGAADDVAREAADAALQELEDLKRRRQALLDGAELRIRLNDVTDPAEQLQIRLDALREAFPALSAVLGEFDVSTQAGRDALEAWIRAIAESPDQLAALADATGLSIDELLEALAGLEDGADAAAEKVLTLAERLGQAFDEVDYRAELEGVTDPLERLRRAAAAAGSVLPELADIFSRFKVDTVEGRAGAEAALIALGQTTTDAAVRSAVLRLLTQLRGIPVSGGAFGGQGDGSAAAGGAASRANVQAASTITEVTGNRLVDLFGRNVAATERIEGLLASALASVRAPLPAVLPPAVTPGAGVALQGGGGAASAVIQLQLPPIVFQGPVTTADPESLGRLLQQRLLEMLQGDLTTQLLVALRRAGIARV